MFYDNGGRIRGCRHIKESTMEKSGKIRILIASFLILFLILILSFEYILLEKSIVRNSRDKLFEIRDFNLEEISSLLSKIEGDTISASRLDDVVNILNKEQVENYNVAENVLSNDINILSREIDSYILLNNVQTFDEFLENREIGNMIARKIGAHGYILLYDSESKEIYHSPVNSHVGMNVEELEGIKINDDGYISYEGKYAYFKNIYVSRFNKYVGVGAIVFMHHFTTVDFSSDEISKFLNSNSYEDLILISRDGQVVFSANGNYFLGQNLEWKSSIEWTNRMYLGLMYNYFKIKNSPDFSFYGPFIDDNGHKLVISSMYPVFDGDRIVGYAALIDDMDNILDSIYYEKSDKQTSEIYLVNTDLLLVSPLRHFDFDMLVQAVDTENTMNCFNELNEKINCQLSFGVRSGEKNSYVFKNYAGDSTIGVYSPIENAEWCLMVETDKDEIVADSAWLIIIVMVLSVIAFSPLMVIFFRKIHKLSKRRSRR